MNILQLIQMLKSGNPQQILGNLLQGQIGNNPMASNLLNMLNKNDTNGIEQLARNLANEKGFNADELYNQIRSTLGM